MTVDLDEVRRLCEAATPGPWSADPTGTVCADADLRPDGAGGKILPADGPMEVAECYRGLPDERGRNAAFIAAARDLVPALADEVERLRAELGRAIARANSNARLAADIADERDTATDRERERIANWFAAEADHWRISNDTEAQCEYDHAAQMVRDLGPGGAR